MLRLLSLLLIGLISQAALAEAPATSEEKPAASQAAAKSEPVAAADAAEKKTAEFKPPPGFYTKKRGAFKVYCKKDAEIGSRFVTEKCLDETQMRDYLLALEVQKRDVDRIRATCSTASVCATQ